MAARPVNLRVARRRADFRERNGRAQGAISPGTGSGSTKLPTATPTAPTAPPPPADVHLKILLSQRVNAPLKGSIETEQLGALTLRGLTQPVIAFNVPAVSSNVVTIRPERTRGRIAPDGAS